MRTVWLTDLHLNFVSADVRVEFEQSVRAAAPDAILLGGDTAEARDLRRYLVELAQVWDAPIYFVLGNHDYYFGSIQAGRRLAGELGRQYPKLHYLTGLAPVALTPGIGLIGHDGWADGRTPSYHTSDVLLNDYYLIQELAHLDADRRLERLMALGDEAAAAIAHGLAVALEQFPHVVLLTHVPPFREACWHQGRTSDDNWAPHFTCLAVGQAIVEAMRGRHDRQLTVLCGHTHGGGETFPLPNVRVLTGAAVYGEPRIVEVFDW